MDQAFREDNTTAISRYLYNFSLLNYLETLVSRRVFINEFCRFTYSIALAVWKAREFFTEFFNFISERFDRVKLASVFVVEILFFYVVCQ